MSFKNGPQIWFDGKLTRWEDATVHVTAHALHYGSSVFEGIRAYQTEDGGTAIFRLEPHIRRLVNSCKLARIDLPYSKDQLMQATVDLVEANGLPSCYIRPLIFRGSEMFGVDGRACPTQVAIMGIEWGRYLGAEAIDKGVSVAVSSWRRMAPGTSLAMAKIGGQYVNGQFIAMEAHDGGFNEAIALDVSGYVSEGSGENIFIMLDNVVYTPPVGSSILSGITRDCAMTLLHDLGYEIREQAIARDMLYIADEIFFTGTAAEITPVSTVDRQPIGSGTRGPITTKVQEQFFGITAGKLPDKYGWLTKINVRHMQTTNHS